MVRAALHWLETHPGHEVILQYISQMFGASRFGSPAVPRLVRALRMRNCVVTILVHELYIPWSVRPDLLLGAAAQRIQLAVCARWATRLAATTEKRVALLKQRLRLLTGAPPVQLVPVGAPVEPVPWNPSRCGLRLGTFSTLGVGKHLDVALDAFGYVSQQIPSAELWLLGDLLAREDQPTRDFRQAVSRHAAADRIRVPGKQALPEVAATLASLHMFLHVTDTGASTRSSTLPLALGTGLPVVAVRGPETDDLFQDQSNVFFATSLSGEAFAEAAMRLRGDSRLAATLGHGARTLYERHLTWPRIADAILASQ
jgi:glycosyltransferase involved in cell wall biosynthesis